ncbi:MAG: homocysteine S-methyltransferase family protein [Myxococcales bacterium]|nr:homocysteine S-methyltransferase family protein [Myxococcales bacterium]
MPRYRHALDQFDGRTLLTDGGLETTLIFHDGFDLPAFASYRLLAEPRGREALKGYFRTYARLAQERGTGIVLETPTWRASTDWGAHLGDDPQALRAFNRQAVALLQEVRDDFPELDVVISGNLGPRGDGYVVDEQMTAEAAERYHSEQIRTFAATEADLVTFLTATYAEEAVGVIRAAEAARMPVVVSFTVETDGRLPSGMPLAEAITSVDAATDGVARAFGVNCAHPDHFVGALAQGAPWAQRIGLIRANASRMSHEELDAAERLDDGDPRELAASYGELLARFPSIGVIGGCCGTDHRHVGAMGDVCLR